ncbi:reverse transcriptase [Gossypium australe]|uniref:Reverse transcriptase n=1 Tax=Gossypium australe TaxID=47621 RepID=A0A5B6VPW7_9ROSI|nr:reverse transcriptase [Gossypium australe]
MGLDYNEMCHVYFLFSYRLSTLMRLIVREGLIIGVKASLSGPQISHLLFAYDCILFGEANVNGAETLRMILKEYENCFGQCVKYDKFIVFYSSDTSKRD